MTNLYPPLHPWPMQSVRDGDFLLTPVQAVHLRYRQWHRKLPKVLMKDDWDGGPIIYLLRRPSRSKLAATLQRSELLRRNRLRPPKKGLRLSLAGSGAPAATRAYRARTAASW